MNVLLIQADQWPSFCLGSLRRAGVRTPNLDRLCAQDGSILFTNNTAQSPICLPSRVSMLTGCYVSTTGQPGFSGYCRRGLPWMPRVFRKAGYRTGAFGKFHAASIGIDDWSFDVSEPTLGEDEDFSMPAGAHYRAYCAEKGVHWPTDQMHGHDPFHGMNLENGGRFSSHSEHLETDMERWAATSDVPEEHSLETWTTDRCLAFLETSATNDQPFFAWLSYDRPHYPTTLPPEWMARIRPDEIQLDSLPDATTLAELPKFLFDIFASQDGISAMRTGEDRFRHLLATYYTLIEWIDHEIGRVLDALDRLKLRDQTIVAFTTDHGDAAGQLGLFDKRLRTYSEAITRIPMVLSVPNSTAPARVVDSPVENVDLFPTLASLCKLTVPADVEGTNLTPAITDADGEFPVGRPVFCEDHWQIMVKQEPWRLTFDIDSDAACQLHNLRTDPDQRLNLYSDPDLAPQRVKLKRQLLRFLAERTAGAFTAFDVERVRTGLDGSGPYLPLLHTSWIRGVSLCHYRAAVVIADSETRKKVLIPFFEGQEPLAWDATGNPLDQQYLVRNQARPATNEELDPMLSIAIRQLMTRPCISLQVPNKLHKEARPSSDDIAELLGSRP